MDNKYVKGLVMVVVGLVIFFILLFLGDAMNQASAGLDSASSLGMPAQRGVLPYWWAWVLIGGALVYLITVFFADQATLRITSREVVRMAVGAGVSGAVRWILNVVAMPRVGQALPDPAIAIPLFFGFVYGPTVGFMAGAFGYVFGQALAGAGISPIWAVAYGLMGLIPGLAGYSDTRVEPRRNVLPVLLIAAALLVAGIVVPLISPNIVDPADPTNVLNASTWAYVMAGVVAALLAIGFVPRLWPYVLVLLFLGLIALGVLHIVTPSAQVVQAGQSPWGGAIATWVVVILLALGAFWLFQGTETVADWIDEDDTRALAAWSALGVVAGAGFGAAADIAYTGTNFMTAFLGEFIPAAGPAVLFAAILTPLFYAIWRHTRRETVR